MRVGRMWPLCSGRGASTLVHMCTCTHAQHMHVYTHTFRGLPLPGPMLSGWPQAECSDTGNLSRIQMRVN